MERRCRDHRIAEGMDAPAGRHHGECQQGRLAATGQLALAAILFRLGPRQEDAVQGNDLHDPGRQHPVWSARVVAHDARRRSPCHLSAAPSGGGRLPRRCGRARIALASEFARCRFADRHGGIFPRGADRREIGDGVQDLARARPGCRRGARQAVRQDLPDRPPWGRVRARCRRHYRHPRTWPGNAWPPAHPRRGATRSHSPVAVVRAQPRRLSPVPRVLVADPIAEAGIARLREHAEVDVQLKQSPASLIARIPDYDALIVRSETRVDANVIQAGTRLKVIGRAGAGVDNIDVEAATRAGVLVVNAPSGNTIAATEHTMAMMLALARHIPQADQAVKAGRWERSRFLCFELRDKVLGVVGLGSIGREVAHRAQAFGMRVIATDPVLSEERASQLNVKLVPFDQLMSAADIVTLHVPLTKETHHLVDARALALAKPGLRLINVARGGIVDESALRDALRDGQVAGAAIDVFEQEPPGENPLISMTQVITTPHLGASTEEAQISVALEITEQVIAVLDGGLPRFSLNAPVALPEAMAFLRPFIPVAEGIGRFYAQVGRQPASRIHVDYAGEIANYDCSVLTAALLTAFLSRFSAERVNPVNARTVAAAHGITVIEQRGARATEFANLISLQAVGEHGTTRVGGTLLLNEPHIVTFDDFRIDLVPHGTFLMSWHADRPGIVGAIGTFLGEKNINIASMQVGRDRPRGDAVMILSVDDPVPESILADIRRIPGMADVLSVNL